MLLANSHSILVPFHLKEWKETGGDFVCPSPILNTLPPPLNSELNFPSFVQPFPLAIPGILDTPDRGTVLRMVSVVCRSLYSLQVCTSIPSSRPDSIFTNTYTCSRQTIPSQVLQSIFFNPDHCLGILVCPTTWQYYLGAEY